MKAIIIATGYAIYRYPLRKNKLKSLLEIGGNSVLDYIIQKMN